MSKQSSFNFWFNVNLRIPEKNVSVYMRNLLKAAYFDAWDAAINASDPIKRAYKAGYDKGYRANRKPPISSG